VRFWLALVGLIALAVVGSSAFAADPRETPSLSAAPAKAAAFQPSKAAASQPAKPQPAKAAAQRSPRAERLKTLAARGGLIAVREESAIYLVDPDSGAVRRVPGSANMTAPAWSPDGKLLAVEMKGGVWTVKPDGTDPQLVREDASAPSWSASGEWIYFVRSECAAPCEPEDDEANVLFSVRPDGKDVRRVEAEEDVDREFAWAPDGDAIGFFADADASNPGSFDTSAATWSPDGFQVAFVGALGPYDDESAQAPELGLWVVAAEGGTPRLLVKGVSGRPSWAR
jgi:Tol biopolymer transport system component